MRENISFPLTYLTALVINEFPVNKIYSQIQLPDLMIKIPISLIRTANLVGVLQYFEFFQINKMMCSIGLNISPNVGKSPM